MLVLPRLPSARDRRGDGSAGGPRLRTDVPVPRGPGARPDAHPGAPGRGPRPGRRSRSPPATPRWRAILPAARAASSPCSATCGPAASLDELKSSFVAAVSHELRTPLALISGHSQSLLHLGLDAATSRHHLERIGDAVERLGALVDEIIDVSRLESDQLVLDRSPTDLQALLDAFAAEAARAPGRAARAGRHRPLAARRHRPAADPPGAGEPADQHPEVRRVGRRGDGAGPPGRREQRGRVVRRRRRRDRLADDQTAGVRPVLPGPRRPRVRRRRQRAGAVHLSSPRRGRTEAGSGSTRSAAGTSISFRLPVAPG